MHLRHKHKAKGSGVIYNGTLHAPIFKENILDKGIGNAGNAVVSIIGSHEGHGTSLGALPETVAVVLAEEFFVKTGVCLVTVVLVAVGKEMLHEGGSSPVLRIAALDAFHFRRHEFSHQVGILAKALFRAAPAGITGKVGIRSPENEGLAGIVLGIEASLVGHDVPDDEGHFAVPGFADAVSLRERSAVCVLGRRPAGPGAAAKLAGVTQVGEVGITAAHDAVDGLRGAGIGNAKARNTLSYDGADLLLDGHEGDGVVKPFLFGKLRILEGIILRRKHGRKGHAHCYDGN